MSLKRSDFEREPCACGECQQAGVSGLPQLRDPRTGAWMHGYPLKRVYEAKASFWRQFHEMLPAKAMR